MSRRVHVPGSASVAPSPRLLRAMAIANALGLFLAVGLCAYRIAAVGFDFDAWFALGVALYFGVACALNAAAMRKLARER